MADGTVLTAPALAAGSSSKQRSKPKSRQKRKVKVDFWATDLNTAEIGIMKRTQNEAMSDQFTKDMELYGQTVINGKREGMSAYRQELWDGSKDFDRRLVIKLFSETLGWRGTAEMMIGRSLQLSLAAGGQPVHAYSINLARHDQLIQLERSAMKWPLLPAKYSFFIQDKSGVRFYTIRRKIFCIGADYTVHNQQGRRIGVLDHQLFNLGGAWMMRIDPDHQDKKLEAVLELFCGILKFNGSAKSHIQKLAEKVLRGRLEPDLDHREEDLYMNPRRRR